MNIQYREQYKFWEEYEENVWTRVENAIEDILNVKKNKRTSLRYAMNGLIQVKMACWCNKLDVIKELSEAGEKYAQIAVERNLKKAAFGKYVSEDMARYLQYICLYELNFMHTGKENKEYLSETVRVIKKVADIDYEKKRGYKPSNMDVVTYATKLGDFELAQEHLNRIFKRKKKQVLDISIAYNIQLFYSYILEYLVGTERNPEIKEKLKECFLYYIEELIIKGNSELSQAYGKLSDRVEIMYLWYKYFSDEPFDQVSPIKIIQSIRYGI